MPRVMQSDAWTNAAWWRSFIPVCIGLWPLHLWLIWHHWLEFCSWILSLIEFQFSDLTATGRTISSALVVSQRDLESRPLAWTSRSLHIHREIIMSQNVVTVVTQMLTHSKIGTRIAFWRDTLSTISNDNPLLRWPRSRHHCFNGIRFLCGN